MDSISALPEQLQHEVFSRVGDVKALFRFAVTCRGWFRRFTDRAFLRELCPGQGSRSGHGTRLLGLFAQDMWRWFSRRNKEIVQARKKPGSSSSAMAPIFLPALGSPLGPAGRALTSFVGRDDDGTFDYAEPLAARHGIVLLRLRLARRTPEEMNSCHLFGVCNPITGDRHVLPPLKWCLADDIVNSYAIITAADGHNDSDHPPAAAAPFTFSQLMVITRREKVDFYLHLYSAATRCWSAPTTCLNRRVFSLVGPKSAVVHRGAAHWLCVDDGLLPNERAARGDGDDHHLYMLSVDVATAHVSLTRLPVRVGGEQLLFVNSDGKLAVTSVYPMHVTVWTPPGRGAGDDDNSAGAAGLWPRTSFRIAPHHHHREMWCNFNHGSLLALFQGSGGVVVGVFILDLHTKVMEKVSILDIDNKAMGFLAGAIQDHKYVPYEMDLVEFFTLQLGGIQERLTGTTTSETESP